MKVSGPPPSSRSLAEVHASVGTGQRPGWRRWLAFAGPAYLVSVGYMDPGNWATDIEGGARFGYQLLWVLVMSNAMAILLQTLSARLGIVRGLDLAQACRATYPRPVNLSLWFLCEIAIAACDLAEVLGAAIALNLLFGLPLLIGVVLTAADTLLLLMFQRLGMRVIEGIILTLVVTIGGCFFVEIWFAKPVLTEVASGLIPRLTSESLYVAIGILGATVMPHNLYLHSALVQTRRFGVTVAAKRDACKYNLIDSAIALNAALFVNAAILIVAAAAFFKRGIVVTEIQQAHELLTPLLGATAASALFAIALLCSGQSSTMTGTLAGQIVMEGFLNIRMRPWLRRLITRLIAIIPAVITIVVAGEAATYKLLIFSQVVLSLQLPFAVIPLIHFTSDRSAMGEFANKTWVRVLAWVSAAIIVSLNIRLAATALSQWVAGSPLLGVIVLPLAAALAGLLFWVAFQPVFRKRVAGMPVVEPVAMPPAKLEEAPPAYKRILVPLDHTDLDGAAIRHASALAHQHGAKVFLLHVEEGVTSVVYGEIAETAEIEAGRRYLDEVAATLRAEGIEVETEIVHAPNPKAAIIRFASRVAPDLLVMGAHGHNRLKDLIFGDTINPVRHALDVPILIVRGPR